MPVNAVIAHRMPGRIRLRIAEKRSDSVYFSALSATLAGSDTVRNVKTNPSTGSVVVEFSGSLNALIEQLQRHDVYTFLGQSLPEKPAALARNGLGMNTFTIVSGRDINPLFMLGSMLALVGIVQTLRGKILIPSLSAFWYALEGFRQSGKVR
jgi:hypothetical protein